MKSFFRYSVFLFIITSSQACTKIIEIDLPHHDEKIIVNSFFTEGDTLKVHLSKSIPILESYFPVCDDAFVKLLENNNVIDTLYKKGQYYYSNVVIEKVKDYSLVITVPGMDSVVCHDIIPELIPIKSYRFADSVMIDENGFVVMQFEFDFDDPPGPNYYEIAMNVQRGFYGFKNNTDPVLISTGLLDYDPKTLIFSDKLIEGKPVALKVNYAVMADSFDKIGDGPQYKYDLNVSFKSISESYYRYKQKQIVYLFGLNTDIFTGSAEPVQLFSNIEGGYGIFAGYISDDKTINVIVQ